MRSCKTEFEKQFTPINVTHPLESSFIREIPYQNQAFKRSDGTTHTIRVLQTNNRWIIKLVSLFFTKITINNQDFYISTSAIQKCTSKPHLTTADKIKKYFDSTIFGRDALIQANKVIETAQRHFQEIEKEAARLKKDQFVQKEYEKITFTIIKTDKTSYEVSTRGKQLGEGSLKTAYVSVPIIQSQLSKVEYSTENNRHGKNIGKSKIQEQLEFANYTLLRKKMHSNTHLLLFQKKYTSPTGQSKIVAEKCDGDLTQVTSTLSLQEKVNLSRQGAKVLASVHTAGYVHLDVKPENFFVTTNPETQEKEIRLADFEFVLPAGQKTTRGTPAFLPPEIIIAKEQRQEALVTSAMDVFSYGATLYELFPLTYDTNDLINWADNRSPQNDNAQILQKQQELRASIDPIHKLIADCIDCDPKKRPSMEEVVKKLEAIMLLKQAEAEENLITSTTSGTQTHYLT